MATNQIKCPHCGQMFDVETALSQKLEEHFKTEYEKRYQQQVEAIGKQRKLLEEQQKSLEQQKQQQEELLKERLKITLDAERKKIEASTLETYQETIRSLEEENQKRKNENKELKGKELSLLKLQQELLEKEEEMSLEIEKQMFQRQKEIEEKARNKERESFAMEKLQLLKQIDDNKKLAEEMKRKAEQGSMQMQGEVQELALEELLKRTYPFDKIEEVPKGIKGADSIQTVINSSQQQCGKIVYESKRTKSFANGWIGKLKQDLVTCKADIAVLVTQTFPSDMDRFGERDGVWICGFHELQSLSFVLREMLIKTHSVRLAQENKGDKMELLYTYLTSNEFVQNIKRIVENYDAMFTGLNNEKKAMHKIWAQREKQIWAVQENLSALFGSIVGIAGKELETSEVLQLPDRQIEE
jgi:hypothetical protein